MRLTLRTLLAYMDDRLPPAKAREIGLKISQSPFAGELLERIREVKRRRRIATAMAAADQPALDANLIAEYLDDQLSPDLVQRIEQKVLASDPLLAEVASAHELLGLLRDPVELEPRLRDRLYALDPSGFTDMLRASGKASPAEGASAAAGWQPEIPRSGPSRYWPALTVTVLGIIWLLSLAADPSLFRSAPVVSDAAQQVVAAAENEGTEPAKLPDVAPTDVVAAQPTLPSVAPADTVTAAEPKPSPAPKEAAMADVEPQGANPEVAARPPAAAPAGPPAVVEAEPVDALPPVPKGLYLQAESRIVLVADEKQGHWTNLLQIRGGDAVVPALNAVDCRPLLGSSWFGIPRCFDAGIRGASQAWQARTAGAVILRIPPNNADFQLLTGQLILTTDSAQAWPENRPPVLTLQLGEEQISVALMSEQTRVAVEVTPEVTASRAAADSDVGGVEDEVAAPAENFFLPVQADLRVRITVLEGSTEITLADAPDAVILAPSEALSWRVIAGKERAKVERSVLPPASIPPWMLRSDAMPIAEAEAVRNRLLDALSVPGSPAELAQRLLADRNPQVGVAAADVLCLTADTNLLLGGLFEGLDEAVHRRIIEGLRAAVTNSGSARQAVAASLETRLSMTDAAFALQLISGLNETLARDRLMTSRLLQYLQGDSLALRTLSICEMERLTGGRQNYFPNADASRRRDAVNRWQKAIERNGGTLLP